MRIDKFSKLILSIIAVNLTILSVTELDIFSALQASEPAQIQNMNYGLVPLNDDGSINVRLSSSEQIDVNITDISTNDEMNVNIAKIGTGSELKVSIESVDQ
jgi:uncharacterized membrane protein YuzA (DUF378 family)